MKLESTDNYSRFVSNDKQRPLINRHVKNLAESISLFGFLPSKPIQVYKRGQKLVIVDGHNRLAAAKSLGVEVYYVIESDRAQKSMAAINELVVKWSSADYVRMYAQEGNKEYQELIRYSEFGIPVNMAASMLINNGAGSGNARESIKNGTFKIKDTTAIDMVVDIITEFGAKNGAVTSRPFIAAISNCIRCDVFDLDVFIRRLRENSSMLEKTSNADQMLKQIEMVYNFRSRSPIPLKFNVEQAALSRSVAGIKNLKTA